jgi:hypothetical protein
MIGVPGYRGSGIEEASCQARGKLKRWVVRLVRNSRSERIVGD